MEGNRVSHLYLLSITDVLTPKSHIRRAWFQTIKVDNLMLSLL